MNKHALYPGWVMHRRVQGASHTFKYRLFSLLLDLDALPSAENRWLKVIRRGVYSFYEEDHGPLNGDPLRPWVDDLCEQQLGFTPDAVKLLCLPRLFGYVFNPLSIFFCYKGNTLQDEKLVAVIYEVRNAYKQQHCYVTTITDDRPHRHGFDKAFYVSPYTPLEGQYHMKLWPPADTLQVMIQQLDAAGKPVLTAIQNGKRVPLTAKNLCRFSWVYALLPFKITAAILWHALRLRLKGLRFKKPPVQGERVSKSL